MYGVLPTLSLLALVTLLFQNQWCDFSEILITISTIFSIITIVTPLILLLKYFRDYLEIDIMTLSFQKLYEFEYADQMGLDFHYNFGFFEINLFNGVTSRHFN